VTSSHDETNARLLELVYDEATPAERAALEAHVATCAACEAELASLGATRAHLRVALDDVPVPARAHARILEAAAQAAATVPAPPARAPAPSPSWWERLRGRWTFPTLATVGAVAVVLLASKVFLDPQRTVERGREALAPAEPQPATVTRSDQGLAKNAASGADLAAAAERTRAMAPNGVSPALGGLMGKRMSEALVRKHRESANLLHGAASREGAGEMAGGDFGAGAASSSGPRGGRAEPDAPAAAAFASSPSDWKGGAPGNAPSTRTSPAPMAAPPPPALRAAPVAASAPRRMQKLSDDSLDGLGAGSAAPAEAKAAPAKPSVAKKSARDEETGADSPAADKERAREAQVEEDEIDQLRAPAKDEASGSKREEAAPPQEVLARRAEQLFAAHRWSAAIAAYRELIRRFPDADLKPRWSARITQAQAESDTASPAASRPKVRAKASKKADVVPVGE